MAVENDMGQAPGTFSDTITYNEVYAMLEAVGGDLSAAERITREINTGTRSIANLSYWLDRMGAQSGQGVGDSTTTEQTYTVVSGDTLSAIAARYGVSVDDLYEANKGIIGSNPDLIKPGQVFVIPGTTSSGGGGGDTGGGGGGQTPSQNIPDVAYWMNQPEGTYSDTITEEEFAALVEEYGGVSEADFARIFAEINSGSRTIDNVRYWLQWRNDTGWSPAGGFPSEGMFKTGVPGDPEIWQSDDGKKYLVYFVPDTNIPLYYEVTDAQLEGIFGVDENGNPIPATIDHYTTQAALDAMGALFAGGMNDLPPTEIEDPFQGWLIQITKAAEVQPWLLDPEVLAVYAEAQLEQRDVQEWELQRTNWWQTHSAAEREWLTLSVADPTTAQQVLTSNRISVQESLRAAGIFEPPEELINKMADLYTMGQMTQAELQQQYTALSDPFSGIAIDSRLTGYSLDTTRDQENEVRALVQRWLGPVAGNWTQSQIAEWAGKLRNDPDAETQLIEMLRGQRQAQFPEYANPELTYEDIAAPWRGFVQQAWGQIPDETNPIFMDILRMNDYNESAKLLREEGLRQGIGKVRDDLISTVGQLDAASQVRRVQ